MKTVCRITNWNFCTVPWPKDDFPSFFMPWTPKWQLVDWLQSILPEVNASGYFHWQQFSVKHTSTGRDSETRRHCHWTDGVTLYFQCNSLPVCPCQPTQATELELEVVPSHAAENVVCCILLSSRLAYPLVPGSFLTGQDLQDTLVCPSASTLQARSPTAFSDTGRICR